MFDSGYRHLATAILHRILSAYHHFQHSFEPDTIDSSCTTEDYSALHCFVFAEVWIDTNADAVNIAGHVPGESSSAV